MDMFCMHAVDLYTERLVNSNTLSNKHKPSPMLTNKAHLASRNWLYGYGVNSHEM